ncbi:MAG TPA: hypothetical protein PLZ32_22145, partial [Saprospiraceae bacterium]|nr:hypothetical protein [Saprospiraceae bacterium]
IMHISIAIFNVNQDLFLVSLLLKSLVILTYPRLEVIELAGFASYKFNIEVTKKKSKCEAIIINNFNIYWTTYFARKQFAVNVCAKKVFFLKYSPHFQTIVLLFPVYGLNQRNTFDFQAYLRKMNN